MGSGNGAARGVLRQKLRQFHLLYERPRQSWRKCVSLNRIKGETCILSNGERGCESAKTQNLNLARLPIPPRGQPELQQVARTALSKLDPGDTRDHVVTTWFGTRRPNMQPPTQVRVGIHTPRSRTFASTQFAAYGCERTGLAGVSAAFRLSRLPASLHQLRCDERD